MYARTSLTIFRPVLREAVRDYVVASIPERVLNDPGSTVGVIAVDRLLEKVGHVYASLIQRTVVPSALKRFLAVSGANPDYPAERFAATPTQLANICSMESRASIGFKFGDEPALLRNLVLPIGDPLLGFGANVFLNDRAVHDHHESSAGHAAWTTTLSEAASKRAKPTSGRFSAARDNGEPVIIGGGRRGVVATACYVARTFGVTLAMPMFEALRLCPHARVIRPDMDKYSRVGREVRQMMLALTPLVEPLSIDEAFLDLSGTERLHGFIPAQVLARFAATSKRSSASPCRRAFLQQVSRQDRLRPR